MIGPNLIEVDLTGMAYGGDSIGRLPDGRAVFVSFSLPGEKVRVNLREEKRRHVKADLVEVLQPSPDRIKPRCPHFGVCGGCHYQHLSYPNQLKIKTSIVREQLMRIGKIENPLILPCAPSPSEWNYRNHVEFHIDKDGHLGYLAPDSHSIVRIGECHLPMELLNTIWPELDFESGSPINRVDLRVGGNDDAMLVLESKSDPAPEMILDVPLSVVYRGPAGMSVLAGDSALIMEVKGKTFQVSAGSFFQVNSAQAEKMVEFLLGHLMLDGEITLFDVYCGVGLFSAFCAEHVGQLVGVEISPEACSDFAANLDSYENVVLYQGKAETILPMLEQKPEVIIVDPPRSGIERGALKAILEKKPKSLAYVSCDPTTLARDLSILIHGGYQLEMVAPFDLFPQTYHIECIALLKDLTSKSE